jgi:hypothetical protein
MTKPRPVHFVNPTPITKSAEERGLLCRVRLTPGIRASSYRDQVTCKHCLEKLGALP